MKVSLCISTYRDVDMLRELVFSLYMAGVLDRLWKEEIEIMVLDDGSPEKEAEKIKVFCEAHRLTHVRQEHAGSCVAAQILTEKAEGDVVCLLDNDLMVPKGWFESLLYFFENNPRFGVASWKSVKMNPQEKILNYEAVGEDEVPERATELAAYCYAFRRECYDMVLGFDANFKYFLWDSDFCCRLAEEGYVSYRILYPYVYHVEHATMDAYPELEARKVMVEDFKQFESKWGVNPRMIQEEFLARLPKQKIKWLTKKGESEGWDS